MSSPCLYSSLLYSNLPTCTQCLTKHYFRSVYVLYGSQTGNGEAIADDFSQHLVEIGMPSQCMNLDAAKKTAVDFKTNAACMIIICSTTGNGDAPENCCSWWRSIKNKSNVSTNFVLCIPYNPSFLNCVPY